MSEMHCSFCQAAIAVCKCPASLARSIDRERAEAVRERNELRAALLAARREVERMQSALATIRDYKPMPIEGDHFSFAQMQRIARAALAATQEPRPPSP